SPAASTSLAATARPASASASASPAASPPTAASNGASGGGQLGMIFEVNNRGWQSITGSPAVPGMAVALVLPGQPGARAGLVQGDVVTSINGIAIHNANIANRVIRGLTVGNTATLTVDRQDGMASRGMAQVDVTAGPARKVDMVALLNGLVSQRSTDPSAYFLRGAYSGETAASQAADFGKAIQLNPNFVSAYVERATLEEHNAVAASFRDFQKALSLDAGYEPAYVNRGVLYASQKDYAHALQDYAKAVSLDPSDPSAYANLGIASVANGNFQQAMKDENQAIQLDPQFGPALLYRGLLHQEEAVVDFRNASRFATDAKVKTTADSELQKISAPA
ncbi:MAG: tetratricopeptide repeat protein, partial [Chloroflexota bacterium]